MKARGIGTTRTFAGGAGPGSRHRRSRRFRRSLLAAFLLVALGHLPASERARADDFDRLVAGAGSQGTVSALVTGWRAITGDELGQGSRGDGPVAITGDEFVRGIEAASPSVTVTRRYRNFPVLAMEMDAAALRAAKSHGSGVEVWEDPVLEPFLAESVEIVGAPEAWRNGYAGRGLAIAIIDDGVDTRHPFLARRTVFEGCFADVCPNGRNRMLGRGAAFPTGSHGTHVAGIALGGAVDEDLAGVGPDLRLIIFRASNARTGGFSGRNILASLDVVLTLAQRYPGVIGAVNMSLGAERRRPGVCRSRIWDYASQLFHRVGVPVVVASGNGSEEDWASPVGFPACVEGFISVGAVTKSEEVASFSNSGPTLDLLAPGVDIRSSIVKGRSGGGLERGYDNWPGTSMAAPHVAAAMALLRQAAPEHSVSDLLRVLKRTGREVRDRRDGGVEAELIDLGEAVESIRSAASGASLPPVPQMKLDPEPGEEPKPDDEGEEANGNRLPVRSIGPAGPAGSEAEPWKPPRPARGLGPCGVLCAAVRPARGLHGFRAGRIGAAPAADSARPEALAGCTEGRWKGMETGYRLEAAPGAGGRGRVRALRLLARGASCVALAGLLAACEAPVGDMKPASTSPSAGGVEAPGDAHGDTPGKLAIIVNLAVDDGMGTGTGAGAAGSSGDDGSVAAVTARVMERLKAAMPAEDFAAVRTFNLFPAIALSADGALIARILAMPEVVSVERDQELQLQAPGSELRIK